MWNCNNCASHFPCKRLLSTPLKLASHVQDFALCYWYTMVQDHHWPCILLSQLGPLGVILIGTQYHESNCSAIIYISLSLPHSMFLSSLSYISFGRFEIGFMVIELNCRPNYAATTT